MRANWSRALFDESTDHGNDVMVAQFVFVLVMLINFPEMLMENNIKNCQCYRKNQINKKFPWPVAHGSLEY